MLHMPSTRTPHPALYLLKILTQVEQGISWILSCAVTLHHHNKSTNISATFERKMQNAKHNVHIPHDNVSNQSINPLIWPVLSHIQWAIPTDACS